MATVVSGRETLAMSSCVRCRARKVKCDRVKPTCGWCLQNNQSCLYNRRQKPGPQPGHAQGLQDKIHQLETSLQLLSRRFEEHIRSGQESGSRMSPSVTRTPTLPQTTAANQSRSGRNVYSGTAILEHECEQLPSASTIPVSAWGGPLAGEKATWTSAQGLPAHEQLCSLVGLYFEHINTWAPLLDRETIFNMLDGSSSTQDADMILLHAIVAVTLRFSKDQRHTIDVRQQYHDASKRKVEIYALENSNVRGLQALAILAVDILGTSYIVEGMKVLSLLAQSISHLGLGVERRFHLGVSPQAPAGITQYSLLALPKSWLEEEERRRLFWIVYSMDRYTMACTTSNFHIDEKEVDRPLPCRHDLWAKDRAVETRWYRTEEPFETTVDCAQNLGSFSYHCEVMRILTQIHEFVKVPLDFHCEEEVRQWRLSYTKLDRQLTTWLNGMAGEYTQVSQFGHSDAKSKVSNWIMLQASFILAAVRLHSAAAYPPVVSDLFTPSYSAMQKCLAAVTSLMRIAHDVVDTKILELLGPLFGGALWVTARLLLVHASISEHQLDPNIYFFISTLGQIGERWDVATRFQLWYPVYKELFSETSSVVCNATLAAYLAQDRHHNTPTCGIHVDCMLDNTRSSIQSSLASAAVFLGLVPTVMSMLGPSLTQLCLLSTRRPVLAFLLALGSGEFLIDRLFRVETPEELFSLVEGEKVPPRLRGWWPWLIGILEYTIAMGAVGNILQNSFNFGNKGIIIFACNMMFLPLLWIFSNAFLFLVAAIPFQFSAVAHHVRRTRDHPDNETRELGVGPFLKSPTTLPPPPHHQTTGTSLNRIFSTEFQPSMQHPKILLEGIPQYETWLVIILNATHFIASFHILMGICFLSSYTFISVTDAISVAMRYLLSVSACRFVLMLELSGMKSNDEKKE